MKKIKLLKIIENGGATLDKNGKAVDFSRGYQVSKRDCYTLNIENIGEILAAVNGLLAEIGAGEFVGLWVDSGLIYIDVSERVERLSAAIVAGIERKQKSIFDWCLSRCIGLEG